MRRETDEQDKHIATISNALTDLSRMAGVSFSHDAHYDDITTHMCLLHVRFKVESHCAKLDSASKLCVQAMDSEIKYQDPILKRVTDHTDTAENQLKNLDRQAIKDHRLGYRRR